MYKPYDQYLYDVMEDFLFQINNSTTPDPLSKEGISLRLENMEDMSKEELLELKQDLGKSYVKS